MAGRRSGPDPDQDGAVLWQRVTETVRPLRKDRPSVAPTPVRPAHVSKPVVIPPAAREKPIPLHAQKPILDTLDGGWDRRLRRGITEPDRTLDLHGHTLLSAQKALDHGLDRAIADGTRVLLLITGKAPRKGERDLDGRPKRGLIRESIGDWLVSSRHAPRIAAVRNAHPKHGGGGALYIILRRERGEAR
jgi:DNA-nicking Smr family endonuclease